MKIKYFILAVFITVCSFAQQSSKPNVLFIAIDDLNACLDGMDGETHVSTPNMSRLADKGVFFLNAHCAAPACNPSRTAVLTGLAPATTGIYANSLDWRDVESLEGRTTLPEHFQNNGYKTVGGGKLYHAASLSVSGHTGLFDPTPWDEYFPSKTQQMPFETDPVTGVPTNTKKGTGFYGGHWDWAELDVDVSEMADAKVVTWAEGELAKTHDKPLFISVGIYRPHVPWYNPKSYFDRHPLNEVELPTILANDLDDVPSGGLNNANDPRHEWILENDKWKEAVQAYNASVSFADDMVGRLIDALENGPLADNTIVVLWSDHGYHLGQKNIWEKFALWEVTTRVPFMIVTPDGLSAGETSNEPVSLLDIYPTLNELCGIPLGQQLDGVSLQPLLENPALDTDRVVITSHGKRSDAMRSDRWRYIKYSDGTEELYDQQTDKENFHNLAGDSQYDSLKEDLKEWLPTTYSDGTSLALSTADVEAAIFSMYPNPVSDILTIEHPVNSDISIYDTLGKLILNKTSNNTTSEIDVASYKNGIYYVKVSNQQTVQTKKIIITP